ncbi:hypothetical protein BT69DRAFT_171098 [Atractiella rhizophila]|nr:hypothetical protein BT69DRAFT_171098 [Atractiella rhizophila]
MDAPPSASFEHPTAESELKLTTTEGDLVLYNISSIFRRLPDGNIEEQQFEAASDPDHQLVIVVRNGSVTFSGGALLSSLDVGLTRINLHRGSILPSATTFGTPMGLQDIAMEESTIDGTVYDPLVSGGKASSLKEMFGYDVPVKAKDGISWGVGSVPIFDSALGTVLKKVLSLWMRSRCM